MAKGSVWKKGKKWYYCFYVEDASTTMNVYAHATREAKRDSAKLLDKVVGMS